MNWFREVVHVRHCAHICACVAPTHLHLLNEIYDFGALVFNGSEQSKDEVKVKFKLD